jgi:hypothetical protein
MRRPWPTGGCCFMRGENKPQGETKLLAYLQVYVGLPAASNAGIIYAKGNASILLWPKNFLVFRILHTADSHKTHTCKQIYIIYTGCLKTYVTNFSWVFPHPHLSKKVPINMGPKVNRFRDIDLRSCADIEYYIRCSSWNASGNPWCDVLGQMVSTLNILCNTHYQHMNVSRYLGTCSLLDPCG